MFMNQKSPGAGVNSLVFYNRYVSFKKVRLRNGKPNSKKRREMEQVWCIRTLSLGDRTFCLAADIFSAAAMKFRR